ncbi:MAG: 16S rRNA (cytidine(1402)-2'-O)-methyltransferase [Clostridia bacterium]|nr:16S rRNA (cytidine(1402)-2'-O)-methyltransferase [Clostridia bacterium]
MSGTLYVVGTPIGNLGDLSPRGLQTLSDCDFIAAEDTRVTLKLLTHFGIRKTLVSYHEHNRRERGEEILSRLLAGENCALVTDAGMPAISDPGEDLVRLCHEHGVAVAAVPGPCAFATALAVSGMPAGRFTFEGFLSVNKQSRREHLQSLAGEMRTMLFYEAPHKLPATLRDLYAAFGDRRIAIVREITKVYEEVIRTTLSEAVRRIETEPVKGEIVLVVEGAPQPVRTEVTLDDAVESALLKMEEGFSPTDAAKAAAKQTGLKKGDIYKALTERREADA